jgi:hypothetical protein
VKRVWRWIADHAVEVIALLGAGAGAVATAIKFAGSWLADRAGCLVHGDSTCTSTERWLIALGVAVCVLLVAVGVLAVLLRRSRAKVTELQREGNERREAAEHEKQERQWQHKRLINFLEDMTEAERALCRPFILGQVRTVLQDVTDGNVHVLVQRGVLYPSGSPSYYVKRFEGLGADFTMTDWAWAHLHAHPELLRDPLLG